ncbi:DUF1102 domain-containing protein [Bacillus luteolus]|uniref:DUF1102 domain-containing protein n=1 Tax=Litchfieldia luteola TaxID=682179 RepID=A0ABR9QFH8_9BACI|nr:DUF1102 domain-containing protein [Cytobacillus luteolus]MBE4907171.1 DUF1102 domain-containing protein [Cytobacillus luteolus]MBP1943358.1 hypothetical protein [Cytobacillus luteolus]
MKKSILMVVALLALSTVMAAFAFSSATIKNDASLTVANTDSSLVALIPASTEAVGSKDGAAFLEDGKLKINLSKGNGANFGVQGDSHYKWENLFTVKNNSKETVEFTITKDGWGYDTKANIYLGAFEKGVKKEFYNRSNGKNGKVTLAPGEESIVYLEIETEKGAKLAERNATLTVNVNAK